MINIIHRYTSLMCFHRLMCRRSKSAGFDSKYEISLLHKQLFTLSSCCSFSEHRIRFFKTQSFQMNHYTMTKATFSSILLVLPKKQEQMFFINASVKISHSNLSTSTPFQNKSSEQPDMKPIKLEIFNIHQNENTPCIVIPQGYELKSCNQKKRPISHTITPQKLLADCKLMIFDKDGTLTHCDKCFGPWIESVANQLKEEGWIKDVKDCLEKALLYDLNTQTFAKNSVMIRDTAESVTKAIAMEAWKQTEEYSSENDEKPKSSEKSGEDFQSFYNRFLEGTNHLLSKVDLTFLNENTLELCGDKIPQVLDSFKSKGINMAICTSDDRRNTQHTLRVLDFDKYFSEMSCGDDTYEHPVENVIKEQEEVFKFISTNKDLKNFPPKPSPNGILRLCRKLNVNPKHSCMVGDSFTDMEAGFRAGCSTCIFVTDGGNSTDDLVSWINNYFGINFACHESTSDNDINVFRLNFPQTTISWKRTTKEVLGNNDRIDFVVIKNVGQILNIIT